MAKTKWGYETVIGKCRVYARMGRSEIVVRVENDGVESVHERHNCWS